MNKVIKKIAMLFMICGLLVSVSFGAWIHEDYEENYQKLKAEVEMWEGKECKYNESGKKLVGGDIMCDAKNVIAFFDEIRAMEVTKEQASRWGICFGEKKWKTCNEYDKFEIARREVREMPRFKNDGFIYSFTRSGNLDRFWEEVWSKWRDTKHELKIRGIKGEYWKAVAKESE